MDEAKPDNARATRDNLAAVPIEVIVSVGTARPLVRDLINMGENTVLALDKTVEDPVDLYVGERLIARGKLEEMDGEGSGKLAVRLTEVMDLYEGAE